MSSFSPKKSQKVVSPAAGGALADAVNPLSLDAQLCFLLYSSTHAMVKVYKPVLDSLGLTYPQYLVMLLLWESEGWTVNALGDRLGLDSGTLTPLLRRMEAKCLVQRARDVQDERRVRVALSADGLALKAKAGVVPDTMRCALGLDDAELVKLRATLADLNRRLSQGAG